MSKNFRSLWSHYEMIGQVCSLCDVVVNVTFPEKVKNPINRLVMILRDHRGNIKSSSETQGQSVGSGEKAWGKFSITRKRAPGYRLSPNFFQKFKRMPAPDWAQKKLCIIVPNRRTVSPEFFSWVRTRRLLSCHTCPVRSPSLCEQGKLLFSTFLTRNEGTTDESKKRLGCYQQEQLNLARIFCFWRITMYL